MPTSVSLSVDQYLRTPFRPDREFIDGEVQERNVGKWEHSRVQALLTGWFIANERPWGVQTATEWRSQVSTTRVRIPDIVLVAAGTQPEVLQTPPLLVVEILSPGDTYSETQERAHDYITWGATAVWIIDPESRTARVCSRQSWTEATRLEVPGTLIHLELATLFSDLGDLKERQAVPGA